MTDTRIKIRINDIEVTAIRDTFLLNAIEKAGIDILTLCHHKDLTPSGNCRLCTVEIVEQGRQRLVTACNFPVRQPIAVFTHSERVLQHRKMLAEMYLGRWPNVPVIQDLARSCGLSSSRFHSPITDENPKACILCARCIRACEEFVLQRILDFAGRGIKRHLTMPFAQVDPHCIGCTSCAYVCPTGAIEVIDDLNHPVNPTLIRDHGMRVNAEMATLDKYQFRMREVGTANIVEVMNKYDLLPIMNYRFGSHPEAKHLFSNEFKSRFFTQGSADACWPGCSMACAKAVDGFILQTGPYKGQRVVVDGPEYETVAGCSNMGCFDPAFAIEFNFYCDTYGLDTISVATCMAFIMECYEAGVIDKNYTGGLELPFGAQDAVLECLHQCARGEGFGTEAFMGIRWLKAKWSREGRADPQFLQDIGMEAKGLEYSEYVSKESLAQQAGYTLAIKGPQHDEAWLIFMDMVNNQLPSFEDKAEALFYFPLWRTWFGLQGLCKIVWNDVVPMGNKLLPPNEAAKIPEHVNNYFKFFEGMTGKPLDEQKMLEQSARVYNLQRCLSVLLGYGRRHDDIPPYRAVGPVTQTEYESRAERYDKQLRENLNLDPEQLSITEKMAALRKYREEQYQIVTDAAYKRRGWNFDGIPTLERLIELNIDLPELVQIIEPHVRSTAQTATTQPTPNIKS
jgi:aldehyde:ferredoxin oxidoreductase